jgi:hypothetical protein
VAVDSDHIDSELPEEQVLLFDSLQQVLLVLLPPLLSLDYLLAHLQLGSHLAWRLLDYLLFLVETLLESCFLVYFHALLDDFAELLDLINGLLVLLLHLLDYLQWPVLLAEHLVHLLSVSLLHLHAVVGSPGALHMECYCASGRLALHACSVSLQADDALQREPLIIELVQPHRRLGSHQWPRYP